MKKKDLIRKLTFKDSGLIPVVVQDDRTLEVLMVAYMNPEAIKQTLRSGQVHFFSRSRKALWHKGKTSGHVQHVREIRVDCDQDALLVRVAPEGPACHTGAVSCFYRSLTNGRMVRVANAAVMTDILDRVYRVVLDRKRKRPEGSYVASLFKSGRDQILKKIGEEAGELIISSKNGKKPEIIWEVADLWFHTLVMMGYHGITPQHIYSELDRRFGQSRRNPNKKTKRGSR